MNSMRLDSKENLGAAWGGAREERSMPARARPETSAPGDAEAVPSPRGVRRSLARFARDAVIGMLFMALVPIAIVSTLRPIDWLGDANARGRLLAAGRLRSLAAAADASITPAQAGTAFNALGSRRYSPGFPVHAAPKPTLSWKAYAITPAMFRSARPGSWYGPTSSKIIAAVPAGFSPAELSFLAQVAEAPVWRDFDLVAHAPAVDMIGGALVLPFRTDAFAPSIPIPQFLATKELAYAGVSRAAYYLATGRPERAEAVLRGIVSFGFAVADNGTTATDGLIGAIIVEIGRDGLEQFYKVTGNARGARLAAAIPKTPSTAGTGWWEGESVTAFLIRRSGDPREPRAMRFESLYSLSLRSCSSVRDLLLGPPPSVADAFVRAKRDLARYPSERAFIDLLSQTINRVPDALGNDNFADRFLTGASTTAGAVFNNPRMSACARLLLD